MSKKRWNKNGELKFDIFDVDEKVHLVNISIAPEKITNKQFTWLCKLVIPRIRKEDVRVQSLHQALNIIAYYPRRHVSEIKNMADCDLASSLLMQ